MVGCCLVVLLLALPVGGAERAVVAAGTALQRQDFRGAAALAEAGLQRQPNSLDLLNILGIARSELGDSRAAEAAFERGLRIASDSVSLNENLGLLFFKRSRYLQAKECLAHAVAVGSQNPSVRYSLAAARLRTGEIDRARAELKAIEPELGNVSEYWEERGRAELPSDAKSAETSFLRATAIAPDSLAGWNGAATAAEEQGAGERALAYLIDFRKQHPQDIPTTIHFAELCIRQDLGPDALDALEKARATEPGNASVLFLSGRANISVGKWEAARSFFLEYLKRNRSYAPALYAVAWVDGQLNRRNEARHYLDLAIVAHPRYPDALCDRAQMEAEGGAAAEADRDVKAALASDGQHVKANLMAGDLLMRKGDAAAARVHYERALQADPQSSAAHYKLAGVLNRQGDKAGAGEERMRAASLAEKDRKGSKTQLRLVLPAVEGR